MTMLKHDELRRTFDLALAAPADQRGVLLIRECKGDAGLVAWVLAVITADEEEKSASSAAA